MRQTLTIISSALLAACALCSCSSTEDIVNPKMPFLTNVQNSDCLSSRSELDSDSENYPHWEWWRDGAFEMYLEGSHAKCKFYSLHYNCDYERVNIKIIYQQGVLSIVEYPSSNNANCLCDIDATFTIEDIPDGPFLLKLYSAYIDGNYDVDKPEFVGNVNLSDGGIFIPYCNIDYYKNDLSENLPQ